MPSPSSSADPASQPGLPALSQIKKDAPGAATGLSSPRPFNPCRLHTALLDLLAALAWDPPEPCYPTLERFFKSHGPSVFQFLLVGPHYPQHQAGAGSKEEQDDDLILTEKSIDVLLSLTSKTEFSKIILEARVHDSTGPTPSQPNPTSSTSNARQQQPQRAKSVGSANSPANHRRSTAAAPPVDPPKTAEQRSEGSGSGMTVVDRLLKVFLLAATNLPGATADDPDRHGLKVKILCLLHLLAINHHRQHQPSADDLAGAEWTGWKALESAGSCLFSVLLKTIFVDSYRLWNVDGAVGHRQLVPRYVERITLSVQIIHKSVFPQSSSSSCSSPRTPLNLVHRIKQESPVFLSTLSSLPFAKLAWLDYLTPSANTSFPFPWDPDYRHFAPMFNQLLPRHLFPKLDLMADLAFDVLSSFASPDELDEWKQCALDDDDEDEEDPSDNENGEDHRRA
ncbi:hypothetical protein PtB15_2B256 [Puccinia triticina]|nr:hypothetical protein PtB15_2B256 [Puccinia triticina]